MVISNWLEAESVKNPRNNVLYVLQTSAYLELNNNSDTTEVIILPLLPTVLNNDLFFPNKQGIGV